MTISLSASSMSTSSGTGGWLSPVVLGSESVADTQSSSQRVQFPVSMISANSINSQQFLLSPPSRNSGRRTKLRSEEEQEVADILVMLRSRSAQQHSDGEVDHKLAEHTAHLTSALNSMTSSPNQPSEPASQQAAKVPIQLLHGSPKLPPITSKNHDSPPQEHGGSTSTSSIKAHVMPQFTLDTPEEDISGEEIESAESTHIVVEAEPKRDTGSGTRPRRKTKSQPRLSRQISDSHDQSEVLPVGGARSVDQSNELEKMLREIGFMAIRTERTSISCSICQQKFPSRMFAVRHAQRDHLGVKPFECEICHMRFVRLDSVPRHVKNVHQRKSPKKKRKRISKYSYS